MQLTAERPITSPAAAQRPRVRAASSHKAPALHPDAELVALGIKFDHLRAAAAAAQVVAYKRQVEALDAWKASGSKDYNDYLRVHDEMGGTVTDDAMRDAYEEMNSVAEQIESIPVKTFAGLYVKFRVVQQHNGYDDKEPRIDQDLNEERFNALLDEVAALAAGALS